MILTLMIHRQDTSTPTVLLKDAMTALRTGSVRYTTCYLGVHLKDQDFSFYPADVFHFDLIAFFSTLDEHPVSLAQNGFPALTADSEHCILPRRLARG